MTAGEQQIKEALDQPVHAWTQQVPANCEKPKKKRR